MELNYHEYIKAQQLVKDWENNVRLKKEERRLNKFGEWKNFIQWNKIKLLNYQLELSETLYLYNHHLLNSSVMKVIEVDDFSIVRDLRNKIFQTTRILRQYKINQPEYFKKPKLL